nr:MAG TPA: hypothetical protein [Bacteriophage sp.]
MFHQSSAWFPVPSFSLSAAAKNAGRLKWGRLVIGPAIYTFIC